MSHYKVFFRKKYSYYSVPTIREYRIIFVHENLRIPNTEYYSLPQNQSSQKKKHKWFVYGVDDTACQKYYVGSTVDPCSRWASTKKACRDRNLTNTGLYKHFHEGCPTHLQTGELSHLTYTLLDYIETSEELLRNAGHTGGVQCRCSECQRLKDTEDKWMCRLGTPDTPSGFNTRDEM